MPYIMKNMEHAPDDKKCIKLPYVWLLFIENLKLELPPESFSKLKKVLVKPRESTNGIENTSQVASDK